MRPALISVTVVTYNSSPFIARCLDAVFQQEYRPLEVIVVDNAASMSILVRYKRCIRLIQNDTTSASPRTWRSGIGLDHTGSLS